MIVLLSIVLGLIAGQYIKLTVDPAMLDFLKRSWSSVNLQPNDIKEKFVSFVNEAKVQTSKARTIRPSKISTQDQGTTKKEVTSGKVTVKPV
jgi:hypothetical protein